jgi:hypothetical protein
MFQLPWSHPQVAETYVGGFLERFEETLYWFFNKVHLVGDKTLISEKNARWI